MPVRSVLCWQRCCLEQAQALPAAASTARLTSWSAKKEQRMSIVRRDEGRKERNNGKNETDGRSREWTRK